MAFQYYSYSTTNLNSLPCTLSAFTYPINKQFLNLFRLQNPGLQYFVEHHARYTWYIYCYFCLVRLTINNEVIVLSKINIFITKKSANYLRYHFNWTNQIVHFTTLQGVHLKMFQTIFTLLRYSKLCLRWHFKLYFSFYITCIISFPTFSTPKLFILVKGTN